jgi:predicted MFS family arabinose efflux permease
MTSNTSATLRLISLAAFTSSASGRVCDPMLTTVAAEFGVGVGDAAVIVSSFAVAYGVLQLFFGPLGDRLGKLRVIMLATLACALFSGLTAFAPTLLLLALCRAGVGAASAGIVPLAIAWVGDRVAYDQRQETLAQLMSASLIGMMAGQWFGGFAAQTLGWRNAFLVLGATFLVTCVVLYTQNRPDRTPDGSPAPAAAPAAPAQSLVDYLRNTLVLLQLPRVRWVLTVTAIEGMLGHGAVAFFPSRLVERFGFSLLGAGGVMMLFAVGGLAYAQFARRWLALLGERGLALVGGGLIAVSLVGLAWAEQPGVAIAMCMASGMGLFMLHSTLQTQATQMAPHARGTAVTLFACALFLSQSVGVAVIAACVNRGLLVPAFVVAAICLALLGAWVSRHVAPRAAAIAR